MQLDFSEVAHAKLEDIRERSGVKTNAELLRNALRLFDWYLEQRERDWQIQVTNGKVVKEVEFSF